ncbi:Proteasome subunit alpha type-6 [Rhodotorula toruloides]|uniref:BY PROTMAP: gi/472586140/gb/EMS23668.1/ 20S proteasome subunit alpha 6 [Rhodosporidium toruloides NP11] gi/647397774/emb/CDR41021.1/ RHTO0S05e10924g1_1 [Rhodosporidium toruloides] n=1 Tax=Rhodotorula toruloides TaxID=5286 RepID=A0A0K3CNP1_RHOTO|nr:Proteasome subunit alpha type-6 [Rhodotorula toruloides]PRQ71560.1 Nucleophile aminohydrolase [Rhodotorula toruloides]
MHRNTYDNDNSTFSPQGRLHQVEYALEAVKQGSACVGLRSDTHVVLLGLKRSTGELASYQKKLIRIDDHIGVAIAGLTSDARVLSNFMRTQAMSSRMLYNRPLPISRIVSSIADKAQINTQHYGKRPYGVGLLVAGYDDQGPHLYEFTPSGSCLSYHALSIGARSQSAKTYLEANFETFPTASLDELVMHGLRALRETLQQDKELSGLNTSVGIVGLAPTTTAATSGDDQQTSDAPPPTTSILPASTSTSATGGKKPSLTTFHILESDALEPYLSRLEPKDEGAAPTRQATAVAGEGAAAGEAQGEGRMETD